MRLSQHEVIPVVLDDQSLSEIPSWGLAEMLDAETGRKRLMVLRPAVRKRWLADAARRRALQEQICTRLASRPFRVGQQLDIRAFSQYLLER